MSVRSLSALALGLVLVLAGCSDDAKPSSDESATAPEPTGPTFTAFADLPGEELLYVEQGFAPIGLRMKTVDAAWQVELVDEIAEAGSHFLVVYIAATGEADDRGVSDVRLYPLDFELHFAGSCEATDGEGNCVVTANPATSLESVPDGEWRDFRWGNAVHTERRNLEMGATVIGAIAFPVPDSVQPPAAIEFCAKGRDMRTEGNCLTVTTPAR